MRLPWGCYDQSQEMYWRHCVTGPALPFFTQKKGILKNRSVCKNAMTLRAPTHRLLLKLRATIVSTSLVRKMTYIDPYSNWFFFHFHLSDPVSDSSYLHGQCPSNELLWWFSRDHDCLFYCGLYLCFSFLVWQVLHPSISQEKWGQSS